jgi:AcrR family transcriptional regulator
MAANALTQWRTRTRSESETKILAAAGALFRAHGYHATTMLAVSREACVSTRTLYKWYPVKADLFGAVLQQLADKMIDGAEAPTLTTGDVRGTVRRLSRAYAKLLANDDIVSSYRIIIAELPRFPELGALFRNCAEAQVIAPIRAWAAEEQAAGRLDFEKLVPELGSLFGLVEHHVLWPRLMGGVPVGDLLTPIQAADLSASIWLARFASID